MARKRSRRQKPAPVRSRRTAKSPPPPKAGAVGPVTLAQARAMATVPAPLERGAKVAVATASPAAVGFERRKLEAKQDLERRRRIKEYRATLAIMKTRGVKGLSRTTSRSGRALKAAARPLQVFAEGDGRSRIVWTADLLPNEVAGYIQAMIEQGMSVMKRTLER